MNVIPIAVAFAVGLAGGLVAGYGSGWSPGAILLGATLTAASTALLGSALQFLPGRYLLIGYAAAAAAVAVIVSTALKAAGHMGFGHVNRMTFAAWAIAAFSALLVSRSTNMRLPAVPRRRTGAR